MDELAERRRRTGDRIAQLHGCLSDTETMLRDKACVYATGSFGRGEAGEYSDLDLFIAGSPKSPFGGLNPLDEICVKADLIEATRRLSFPDFDADGRYLTHYSADKLVELSWRASR